GKNEPDMPDCTDIFVDQEEAKEIPKQVEPGRGSYRYELTHVGEGKGDYVKEVIPAERRCKGCWQVVCCLLLLVLFVGLLLWLTQASSFLGQAPAGHSELQDPANIEFQDFDCLDGLDNSQTLWNDAKKKYCCDHQGKGCSGGSGSNSQFNCQVGQPGSWSVAQRAFCCDQGVSEACHIQMPFDCQAGQGNWRLGWSSDKKTFCCNQFGVGCDGGHADETHHVVHHVVHHNVVPVPYPVPAHAPHPHPRTHVHVIPVPHPVPAPAYHAPHPETHVHVIPVPHPVPAHHVPSPAYYGPDYHEHATGLVLHEDHGEQPYRCHENVEQWTTLWSAAKKDFCCQQHSVFCLDSGSHFHDSSSYFDEYHHHHHGHHFGGYYDGGYYSGDYHGQNDYHMHGGGGGFYGHGSNGYYGHGSNAGGESGSGASISQCAETESQQCPASWKQGAGGFHCLHQLSQQTSRTAYLKSGGACRPASQGPFPYSDCQHQCRISTDIPMLRGA
ncbi:unnamed protein product, partial [Effrenium voratum]